MRRLTALLIVALVSVPAMAASRRASAPRPAADGPADPAKDPRDRKVWKLTRYLEGTAPEVRDKLNKEPERLLRVRASLDVRVAALREKLKAVREEEVAAQVQALERSDSYKKLVRELDAAQKALDLARRDGTPQQRVDASGVHNKLRMRKKELEDQARKPGRLTKEVADTLAAEEKELAEIKAAMEKALAWRAEVVDAIKNGFKLEGPLAEGDKGIVREFVPIERTENGMIGTCKVFFPEERVGEGEGITTTKGLVLELTLVLLGDDAARLQVGKKVDVERTYEVIRILRVRGESAYVLSPIEAQKDETARLLDLIRPEPGTGDAEGVEADPKGQEP